MVLEKTWGSATRQRSEATLEEALTGDIRSFYSPSRYTVLRPPLGGCVRSICSCWLMDWKNDKEFSQGTTGHVERVEDAT